MVEFDHIYMKPGIYQNGDILLLCIKKKIKIILFTRCSKGAGEGRQKHFKKWLSGNPRTEEESSFHNAYTQRSPLLPEFSKVAVFGD